MRRVGLLLLVFLIGQAQAETTAYGGLDLNRLTSVYTEALGFIAPRILDPVPVSRLTIWGLRGMTSLDPALQVETADSRVRLTRRGQTIADRSTPNGEAAGPWVKMAVELTAAGYQVSAPLRRAGTQGLIQCFFDEMFSHIDIYSRYVPPAEAGADRANRAGRAGLGLTVAPRGALTEIRSVIRDSPGAIAGIKPGDILLAVDGQRTTDQDLRTINALLAGDDGSDVTLTVRGRDGRTRKYPMVRAMVPPETVFARRMDDVLVLRITGFSETTASHIALSVQDAMAEPNPVSGIVLDLRDNRGGLLRQAVTAADEFLPGGLIAVTQGRDPDADHIWRSVPGELAEDVPLVILVDGHTASAAEILAAALSDRGRAVVVGSATVGKGLVQTIDPMPDGGELFVTWSRVIAPLGWPIQGIGVLPQVCTSLGDEALNRELAALSTGFQPMAEAIRRNRAARVPVSASEELEIRAPCPAAAARAADLYAARALVANPAAYAAALLPPMPDQ
ncbi:MAG TPA: S41 family peptidase [Rhodopila sp.]|uniref:S41 family peptidase n=1 Tax=Rhodopila sp. TaxID=2480087 RepID=UPI002D122FF9|nr:S41 family peptidase [Rhodopila sp.]HVY17725.1 S41 family peptidase [Rhodopila sp.]